MTEYTRQMHEKIMKIYRRETIRQYLWASIGFFPPVGALLLMIPLIVPGNLVDFSREKFSNISYKI